MATKIYYRYIVDWANPKQRQDSTLTATLTAVLRSTHSHLFFFFCTSSSPVEATDLRVQRPLLTYALPYQIETVQLNNNPLLWAYCTPSSCLLSNAAERRASPLYLPLYVGSSNSDCKEWPRENGRIGVAGASDRAERGRRKGRTPF